jgi:S-adenosylmethionine:tRNA ribosyltransferase-isomerase
MPITLDDFDYKLPDELIAQHPPAERGASRLLHLAGAQMSDLMFADLPGRLRAGDLLVFNDTRVIKARLHGEKSSGGKIEVLIERVLGEHEALAQIRASKPPRAGTQLRLNPDIRAEVMEKADDLYHLRFKDDDSVLNLLERHGAVPLPPYVTHAPDTADEARYQTVYARNPGAVAAPTAGLHFDAPMLERLRSAGVELAWITLHVGAGTFQPVRHNDLEKHRMHSEWFSVPPQTREAILAARARGGSVIAVGTTSMRALESAARVNENGLLEINAGESETRLFILPGYQFRIVDRLITNFHLPRSTLLMLVSAFGGMDNIRRAYSHAVEARYRFFSYGDAMLIDRMRA